MDRNTQQETVNGLDINWRASIGTCLGSTGVWLSPDIATEVPYRSFGKSAFKPFSDDISEFFGSVNRNEADFNHPVMVDMKALALQETLMMAQAIAKLVPALEAMTPAAVPEPAKKGVAA